MSLDNLDLWFLIQIQCKMKIDINKLNDLMRGKKKKDEPDHIKKQELKRMNRPETPRS
jgi:hypothetical protein